MDAEEEARDERIYAERQYEADRIGMLYDQYIEDQYDRWCEWQEQMGELYYYLDIIEDI